MSTNDMSSTTTTTSSPASADSWLQRVRQTGTDTVAGWLPKWRHNQSDIKGQERGQIHIIPHPILAEAFDATHFIHQIPSIEIKTDDSGNQVQVLTRVVVSSPEDSVTIERCNYRDKTTGLLKFPPRVDPILMLREWIRAEVKGGRIPQDAVLFEWTNPKPEEDGSHKKIQWAAKYLADLVDRRDREFWGIHLRPRREEVVSVVQWDKPDDGPVLSRERSSLIKSMGQEIEFNMANAQKFRGNAALGDPFQHPYVITWIFDNRASGTEKYVAKKLAEAELTELHYEALSRPSADPRDYVGVRPGDKDRVYTALTSGWVYSRQPPWEALFQNWDCPSAAPPTATESDPAPATSSDTGSVTTTVTTASSAESSYEQMPTFSTEPVIRTNELVACVDGCPAWLHPQWNRCPACGTDFTEVVTAGVNPPPTEWLKRHQWFGFESVSVAAPASDSAGDNCFACGQPVGDTEEFCGACGTPMGNIEEMA